MTATFEEALRRAEEQLTADPDHQRSVQEAQIANEHAYIVWKHKLSETLRRWKGPDE